MAEWIPKYVHQEQFKRTRDIITALEWNNLFNLLQEQGNHNAEKLAEIASLKHISSDDIVAIRMNSEGFLEISKDGEDWVVLGSSGHNIMDAEGNSFPQRKNLKFVNLNVHDDAGTTVVELDSKITASVAGGSARQVLVKQSEFDYETEWVTLTRIVDTVLEATGWVDGIYTLTVEGVTENSYQEIIPGKGITKKQLEALQTANIVDDGQAENTIILKAFGEVPVVDAPIRVIMKGDI